MYVVIDVETTGGRIETDRITEIALYRTDGKQITDQFTSLLNPQKKIDPYVQKLTGITDDMVSTAPLFEELADTIEKFTCDAIFVAHNIGFDYTIVKREFKRIGKHFRRENLCTVRLAQKALKGMHSYSLGQLCAQLNIDIENRHRASGDALATVELLHKIIQKKGKNFVLEHTNHQTQKIDFKGSLTPEMIESLPEEPGIFSFLDKQGNSLLIEASKNIFNGVTKFLINEIKKHYFQDLVEKIAAIDTQVVNSFLIAELMKVEEIQQKKPTYNRKKIKESHPYGIVEEKEHDHFLLSVKKDIEYKPLWSFNNKKTAERFLKKIKTEYGLYPYKPAGYINGSLSASAYNERHQIMLKNMIYPHRNFFIIDEVVDYNEVHFVWIENYIYQGIGKIDTTFFDGTIDALQENATPCINTPATQQIIQRYLKRRRNLIKPY